MVIDTILQEKWVNVPLVLSSDHSNNVIFIWMNLRDELKTKRRLVVVFLGFKLQLGC